MINDLYQEYLFVIGKIKDVYNLHVEVDHKDIHTFFKDGFPAFKLMYGVTGKTGEHNIVITFHIDFATVEAIRWFMNVQNIHPLVKLADVYIEDARGETYLGAEAEKLWEVKREQDTLAAWLEQQDEEEIQEFVEAEVYGRIRDPAQTYNSPTEVNEAITEFERMKKPDSDDEVH